MQAPAECAGPAYLEFDEFGPSCLARALPCKQGAADSIAPRIPPARVVGAQAGCRCVVWLCGWFVMFWLVVLLVVFSSSLFFFSSSLSFSSSSRLLFFSSSSLLLFSSSSLVVVSFPSASLLVFRSFAPVAV